MSRVLMCFAPHVPCPVHTGGGEPGARSAAAAASVSTGGNAASARNAAAKAPARQEKVHEMVDESDKNARTEINRLNYESQT